MADWMIETHSLSRVYGDGNGIRALDGVDLTIARGALASVMGPSGSGKSTLLHVLGALDKPTSGRVLVDGQDLAVIHDVDDFRSRTVGFIFQLHNLLPTLTARENVEVPMTGRLSLAARRQRSAELMELVGLGDRSRHLPGQLSGGQRQRVAIARALANNPPLVLADEPTGALDTASGQDLMKLLHDLNRSQGTTFVVVTHDQTVARQTDRIFHMLDGRIVGEDIIGAPLEEDLKAWRLSGLGRLLATGNSQELAGLGISAGQAKILRALMGA